MSEVRWFVAFKDNLVDSFYVFLKESLDDLSFVLLQEDYKKIGMSIVVYGFDNVKKAHELPDLSKKPFL